MRAAGLLPTIVLAVVTCGGGGRAGPLAEPRSPLADSIPAQGTAATLDVANWNVEWFGATAFGPTDEGLQLRTVQAVMKGMDADVWGLAEVCDTAQFRRLVSGLPGYAGLVANAPGVRGGASYYSAGEQKVALVWRADEIALDSARVILAAEEQDFAGRPPVEFHLRITIAGKTEPLVVIVLHAKAGAELASWRLRNAAAQALKSYLDATWPTQKVLVVGDFNDLALGSILAGQPSPYQDFLRDPARYTMVTRSLEEAGLTSETNYRSVIDHQLATNEMAADYVSGSVEAFLADHYVKSFATTTSDHYPVLARYRVP